MLDETMKINMDNIQPILSIEETLKIVCLALKERGYNPINQLIGYLISQDISYITKHRNVRILIRKYTIEEIMTKLLENYINNNSLI